MRKKLITIFSCIVFYAIITPSTNSLHDITTDTIGINTTSPEITENWTETQKLLPSDGTVGAEFGFSVSLSGNTALIGEPFDDSYKGAGYIFINTGDSWVQQAKLIGSDAIHWCRFGRSVYLAGDTALIGAPGDDDNGNLSGSVYVFTRTGTIWTQQAKLLASDGAPDDRFGWSVSLYNNTALIGAYRDGDNGEYSGSAYVFTRTNTTWIQEQKLIASDGESFDFFGSSVSITADTALIGAPGYDYPPIPGYSYVFIRSGTTWTQQAKLLAPDCEDGDHFGDSIVLAGDTVLIGATADDDNGYNSGSVYVFTCSDSIWTYQQKLLALDGAEQDMFGVSVSLSNNTALIGAVRDDDYTGSAYVFTRNGTIWTQQAKLIASDGSAVDCFADSVSIDTDTALIGAPSDDDNGLNSGSAYIFTKKEKNKPPNIPLIIGPNYGKIKTIYDFSIGEITDPDEDQLYCMWDWGDENPSDWLGPFNSGTTINESHAWNEPGIYIIRVKLKDTYGTESNWSDAFAMYITSKIFLIGLIKNVVNQSEECTIFNMSPAIIIKMNQFNIKIYSSIQILLILDGFQGLITSRILAGRVNGLVIYS